VHQKVSLEKIELPKPTKDMSNKEKLLTGMNLGLQYAQKRKENSMQP